MYPTIDVKATGTRIHQIMNRRKLTVKDIQKYLNLSSVQSIYHWFNGQSMPSVDNLYALSELFQVPMDMMIAGSRKDNMLYSDKLFYARIYMYYIAAVRQQEPLNLVCK